MNLGGLRGCGEDIAAEENEEIGLHAEKVETGNLRVT